MAEEKAAASNPPKQVSADELKNKVVLICIDGWGLSKNEKGNAILRAKTPNVDHLSKSPIFAELDASGLEVGLPKGVMGNSEVGHLTIGSGRVEFQDLVRINLTIEDGSFGKQPALVGALDNAKKGNGRIHFLGLVSDGAVHSHIDHLFVFLQLAQQAKIPNSFVHFFSDGRDTKPTSGVQYIRQLQDFMKSHNYGSIATLMGRFYAMDRDKRWDRIHVAYDAMIGGVGEAVTEEKLISAVEARYAAGENDEFLKPFIVNKEGLIKDGDTLIFIDFRSDRMREIVETLGVKPPFDLGTSVALPKSLHVVQMTKYNADFRMPIIFPPQSMDNVLAEWLSKHGLKQFHTAETEKYAHVTFFFNGGVEQAFPLEDRKLVASPQVKTYDLKPDMSVAQVADSVVEAMASGVYPFVMCNMAPPDMVGHTGMFDPAVVAVEATDKAIGVIFEACKKYGYVLAITADHGNAEEMEDETGKPKTSHTTNPVFFIVAGEGDKVNLNGLELVSKQGGLKDVAPSILKVMGLPIPVEMTGKSLLK